MAHGTLTRLAQVRRGPHTDAGARARRTLGVALAAALGLTAVSWMTPVAPAASAADTVIEVPYTGAPQEIIVPVGASSVTVVAQGGSGGSDKHPGGAGAIVSAVLPVTSGETLTAVVGGNGGDGGKGAPKPTAGAGGYNGGAAGYNPGTTTGWRSGGGGGATDLRRGGSDLQSRVLVAGGGGGASNWVGGGSAGGAVGGAAPTNEAACHSIAGGGTQTGGGVGASVCISEMGPAGTAGSDGGLGVGGQPGYRDEHNNNLGGGGGGGFYVGGGGNAFSSGAAGSSYIAADAHSPLMKTGALGTTPFMTLTFSWAPAHNGLLTLSKVQVLATGSDIFEATASLTSADGRPVIGDTVTFTSDDPGQFIGQVTDRGDGTYSVPVTSSTRVGTFTMTARAASNPVLTVNRTGTQVAGAAARAVFDQRQYPVTAGDQLAVPVSFSVTDSAGNPVDASELVVASADPTQTVSAPQRTGVGRYTVSVAPGTVAGDFTLTATAASTVLGATSVRVTPAAAERVELELERESLVADDASTTTLKIRFVDRFDNLTTGTIHYVGVANGITASDFPVLQQDGSYLMPLRAGQHPGVFTIAVHPSELQPQTVQITLTQAPATRIAASIVDSELVADGSDTTLLTAVVKNQFGQQVKGHKLSVVSSDPATGIGTVTDNGDGTYSADITTSTVAGPVTLTVTDTSVEPALRSDVSYTQVAGPIARAIPTLSTYRIVADGLSTTQLTMTLADAHGNPIDGRQLRVESTDPGVTTGGLIGQGNGTYVFDVQASTVAGVGTLTVFESSQAGMPLAVLVLEQVAGPAASLTAGLDDASLVADGDSRTDLRVSAADTYGNPATGATITASSSVAGVRLGDVQNRGDGNYVIEVTSSTVIGDAVLTVSDGSGNPAATKQVTLRQVVGPAHALTADLADAALLADGAASTVVTLRLADRHDNPIIGAAPTVMTLTPGVGIGAVQDHGDGTYTAVVTASATAGDALLLVSGGPGNTGVSTQLTLTQLAGAVDGLTAQLADARIVADGIASTTLTVTAADAHGNPLAGEAITAVAADGATVGPVTDNGDGSYTATVTSSTRAGDAVITVTDSSVTPAVTSTVTLAQVAGPARSLTADLAEYALPADGIASTALTLKLADLHGNPIVGANPTVMTLADGVKIGAVRDHGDGTYIASVTASTVAGDVLLLAAGGPGNAGLSTQVTLTQRAGAADTLTAQLADTRLVADGVAGTTLTVTAADVHGNPLTGQPITVTASDPRTRIGTVIDAGDGSYTAAIVSSFAAGAVTLTVTDTSVTPALTHTVELMQLAGEPEAATLTLDDTALLADGESSTALEVGVVDAHGNPVIGARIGASSTDAGQQIGEPEEIAPGLYRVNVRASKTPGTSTLTVGTLEEQGAPGTARAARDAAEQTGFGRVLGTIDLEQQTVPVEPEEKPEPEKKPDPKPEPKPAPKPEPGNTPAQPTEPKTDPKLARSGAVAATLPLAGGALLLAAGAVLLLRLNGRRSARRSE